MSTRTDTCFSCRLGYHEECQLFWDGAPVGDCCCMGAFSLGPKLAFEDEEYPDLDGPTEKKWSPLDEYIENFQGSKPLADYADPVSSGRKRAAKDHPIPVGTVCEWAWLAAAGGGVEPIVGCTGRPASDLHHGPDKNTWNNNRGDNLHWVCDWCHNTWHARNDPYYGPRPLTPEGRVDASVPFLPGVDYLVVPHDARTKADDETVYDEERRRRDVARRHGNLD